MRQLPCSRWLAVWLAVCGSAETVSTAQAQMVTATAGLRSVSYTHLTLPTNREV